MDPAWRKLATTLGGIGLMAGLVGCYIPGGGWTVRTGVDVRQICKPAAFVELVDTKWDEWNRVSQMNLYENGTPGPMVIDQVMTPAVPVVENTPTPPLQAAPAAEQPAAPRGLQPTPSPPEAAPADDVPVPPAAGNTSAGNLRNRVRRRREAYDGPDAIGRGLLPASGEARQRQAYLQYDSPVDDRGPVTLGTLQTGYEYDDDQAVQQASTPQRPANRPLIRPRSPSSVPAQNPRLSPQGAWVFSRP